jgi:hypothetical protein
MLPEAKGEALLYVSREDRGEVAVLSYPKGKSVGSVGGFARPWGLCTDNKGNVFVTDEQNQDIVEYAHGGSSPIATLSDAGNGAPGDCSFDATTGNLAVTNYAAPTWEAGGPGNLVIYANEQGTPTMYSIPKMDYYFSCAYDNQGNLFVSGGSGGTVFAELPKGSASFEILSLPFFYNYALYWDGHYIAVGAGTSPKIYRLSVSGSNVKVAGTVTLDEPKQETRLHYFWIGDNNVVGALHYDKVGFWPYPRGGQGTKFLTYSRAIGVTVSLPTK